MNDSVSDGVEATRSGRCRSCSASIVWVKNLEKDKWHICNPPVKMFVRQRSPNFGEYFKLDDVYESHFSTCPDADKWRKHLKDADGNRIKGIKKQIEDGNGEM